MPTAPPASFRFSVSNQTQNENSWTHKSGWWLVVYVISTNHQFWVKKRRKLVNMRRLQLAYARQLHIPRWYRKVVTEYEELDVACRLRLMKRSFMKNSGRFRLCCWIQRKLVDKASEEIEIPRMKEFGGEADCGGGGRIKRATNGGHWMADT